MESGFSNPISIKSQSPKNKPVDGKKTPWEHQQPQYDQRSSCFVNAGTNYGVGRNQPVGHVGNPKMDARCLPRGKVDTMRVDETY